MGASKSSLKETNGGIEFFQTQKTTLRPLRFRWQTESQPSEFGWLARLSVSHRPLRALKESAEHVSIGMELNNHEQKIELGHQVGFRLAWRWDVFPGWHSGCYFLLRIQYNLPLACCRFLYRVARFDLGPDG